MFKEFDDVKTQTKLNYALSGKSTKERGENMSLKIKAKETIQIDDTKHRGEIIEVKESENTEFDYIDVIITVDDKKKENGDPITLRYGCPMNLSKASKLGRLLSVFNVEVKPNKDYDIEEILKNKKIQYMTVTESTKDGNFARIIPASIKEIKE